MFYFIIFEFFSTPIYADINCNTGYTGAALTYLTETYMGECMDGYQEYTFGDGFLYYPGRDVTRCPAGRQYVNGSCVQLTQGDCDSGFLNNPSVVSAFSGTYMGECMSGYVAQNQNRNVAYLANNVATRCGAGRQYVNGSCVQLTQGDCDSGFLNNPSVVSAFSGTYMGECMSGYVAQNQNRNVAYLANDVATRCGAGYYHTSGGCVANPTAGCPTNYYEPVPTTSFAPYNSNAQCDSGYSLYDSNMTLCRVYTGGGTTDLCTPLCSYGYEHTITDTCESPTDNSCMTGYTYASTSGNTPAHCNANTITINWDGLSGANATTSCSYDGAITTPTTMPTRRGHAFAGWVFVNSTGESNNGGN